MSKRRRNIFSKKSIAAEPNPWRVMRMALSNDVDRIVTWPECALIVEETPSRMRRLGCGDERPFNPRTAERWERLSKGRITVEGLLQWSMTAKPRTWGRGKGTARSAA